MLVRRLRFAGLLLLASTAGALATPTDEIQVYTSDIEPEGVFGLTWHNNFTPDGLKTPDYPGALIDNHAYSSVTEFAYGVTPWFEAGLYLPLYANSENGGWTYNGFKLRALFVKPDYANNDFYYGMNFEDSASEPEMVGIPESNTGTRSGPSSVSASVTTAVSASPSIPSSTTATRAGSPGWNSIRRRGSTTRSMTPGQPCAGGV